MSTLLIDTIQGRLKKIAAEQGFATSTSLRNNPDQRIARVIDVTVGCQDEEKLSKLVNAFSEADESCRHVHVNHDPGAGTATVSVMVFQKL